MPRIERALHSVLRPETSSRVGSLRKGDSRETISRYALGAVVIAVVAGTVEGGAAWLLGAPFPLALAVLAGLLDLVARSAPRLAASCSCS